MIELSNGHKFMWQCGSGALAFDGKGWWWEHPLRWAGLVDPSQLTVVAKTVTSTPRKGNLSMLHPWTCVRPIKNGTVNAVGLTNPGIKKWVSKYYPRAVAQGYNIAASVESDSWEDAFTLGTFLRECKLAFVEVNVSCPNIGKKDPAEFIMKVIKGLKESIPNHPLILKLSFTQSQDEDLIKQLASVPEIEAFHAINSVPWDAIFPGVKSPIERYTGNKGGLSGPCIHQLALTAINNVSRLAPQKPIVAGGGITTVEDIVRFKVAGAEAYSFGTLFLNKPWRPNQIMSKFRDYPMDFEQ